MFDCFFDLLGSCGHRVLCCLLNPIRKSTTIKPAKNFKMREPAYFHGFRSPENCQCTLSVFASQPLYLCQQTSLHRLPAYHSIRDSVPLPFCQRTSLLLPANLSLFCHHTTSLAQPANLSTALFCSEGGWEVVENALQKGNFLCIGAVATPLNGENCQPTSLRPLRQARWRPK